MNDVVANDNLMSNGFDFLLFQAWNATIESDKIF